MLLLADLVVLIHALFIVFVVAGGLLAWRWPRIAWLHLPAAAWGAGIELFGGICPLTPLENWLRIAAGEAGYAGGFIGRYLLPVIYPADLGRELQLMLGIGVLVVNAAIYGALLLRHRRRQER